MMTEQRHSPDYGPLSMLIVEDEALIAADMEYMIEREGHLASAMVNSVGELLKVPQSSHFDLALVDVQLAANSSGLDACAIIRRRWPDCMVVFVTANPKMIPAEGVGEHGVIMKPFSEATMRSAIRYAAQTIHHPPPFPPVPDSFFSATGFRQMFNA